MDWAELHLHLEGTLEPEFVLQKAAQHRISLPWRDADDLRSRYRFKNLQEFLDLYYVNMQVLRTAADFTDMTNAYLRRAQQVGVRRAEVFLDLQAHTERGIDPQVVLEGVHEALSGADEQFGISAGLIVTFLRHLPAVAAKRAYKQLRASGVPVLGVGLCSTEVGIDATGFAPIFEQARNDGLHTVAHAGEEGGADVIWHALNVLQVERIDHGINAVKDPSLMDHLVARQIPLTICPLSNVRLQAVPSLEAHPLPQMLRAGVNASIHSDDPAYFGGYLDANLAAARQMGLNETEITQLSRNGFASSFG